MISRWLVLVFGDDLYFVREKSQWNALMEASPILRNEEVSATFH